MQPDASGEGALARALAWCLPPRLRAAGSRAPGVLGEASRACGCEGVADTASRDLATLAYYDAVTAVILANLGLSTQLAILGVCLVLGAPAVYLWLVLGFAALAAAAPGPPRDRRAAVAPHAVGQNAPRRTSRWPFIDAAASEQR